MSWGLWGALAGAGAAVLFAPFTGGASLATIPKFLVLAGAGAGIGAGVGKITGAVLKNSGDTPANELKQAGVDPNKLHEEAKEYREKRQDFLNEKNKEEKKEIGNLEKKLESLDETINNLSADIQSLPEGPEKIKKAALLNQKKEEKKEIQAEIAEKKDNVKKRNEKIDKIFQELGDPVKYTATQYSNNANSPYWGSWKNWGIGLFCVIIFIMLIGFLKRILNGVAKSIK